MKRYLLDTNAVSDCVFRRRDVHDRVIAARRAGATIGTCCPVLAEIFAGMEYSDSRDKNIVIVNQNLRMFRLWPFDLVPARNYGIVYAELRRSGRPIQPVDMMVAAIAMSLLNCTVVSCDFDLLAVKGLNVENWAT